MRYTIDYKSRPVYLQLYRQIRDDIIAEYYRYGTKLPSKRLLAEETGVSLITVEHAYALLCDEGYVDAKERSGYIVIFQKDDGFTSNVNITVPKTKYDEDYFYPEFPISVFNKTIRKVMAEKNEFILKKSPNNGLFELREAIQKYLARNRGIQVETSQIIIGAGSEYLYGLIIELLGRSRIYAIESPSYNKIEQVYASNEVKYESLSLSHSGIKSSDLQNTNATVLHTTPYRSFPSGVTASASKRHEYIRWANKKGRYILEDDFESEFSVSTKPTEPIFALSNSDNVIYLNTFSKTISSSLRIAYMVLPQKLCEEFEEKLGFYSCTVPTFIQQVIAELLNSGDFERHINRVRRKMRKELHT